MRHGAGWATIALIYVATLASMAMVGVVAALTGDLGSAMGVTHQAIGLALAMFSLPSALGAIFCGGLVDRIGARRVIIGSLALCTLADGAVLAVRSSVMLSVALGLGGVGFTGISVAAPAMIVRALSGDRQVRAMSLWSTYAPTGFALGLLIGAPFAGTGNWPVALAMHGLMVAVLALVAFSLPEVARERAIGIRAQWAGFLLALRSPAVLRLAVAVAVPSALSYGTSLIAPTYFGQVYGTSMGTSATVVAAVKGAAMVLCGWLTGALLTRLSNWKALFAGLALLGVVGQAVIFWPGSGLIAASAGLFFWLVAFSGLGAVAMAQLPVVVSSHVQGGAASGVVGQAVSILSFMAPSVYFGMGAWSGYVAVAGAGLLVAAVALPGGMGGRLDAAWSKMP
jgi:MFS family permease